MSMNNQTMLRAALGLLLASGTAVAQQTPTSTTPARVSGEPLTFREDAQTSMYEDIEIFRRILDNALLRHPDHLASMKQGHVRADLRDWLTDQGLSRADLRDWLTDSVAFSPDGKRILREGTVRVWDRDLVQAHRSGLDMSGAHAA